MNRIDRYIAGLFWLYFVAGLAIFVTVFIAVDILSTLMTYENVQTAALVSYYTVSLPDVIYRMIPVACMLSIVFSLTTLNRSAELVALFSVGMSLFRISIPMLISVIFICAIEFVVSDKVLPNFARQKNYIFYHEVIKKPNQYAVVKTNKIWYRSRDNIFYIKTLNEKTHRAQGLTLYTFNEKWDLIQMMTAEEVDMSGAAWKLKDGSVTLFTEESSFPLTSDFKEKTIVMVEASSDISTTTAHTSDVLSLGELSQFIKKNKEAGLDTVRYEVDYYSKYGFSVAALVMSLLGIPFSVGKARSGGVMKGVSVSVALVFLYWTLYNSFLTLGNFGQLPPLMAAWTPNLFMGGLALYFIRKLKR